MIIIEKLTQTQLSDRSIFSWSIWEKNPSEFEWFYENQEQCYFLEGEVLIETDQGDYHLKAGDFVTFPKGLSCKWKIICKVRKHYKFD